MTSDPSQSEGFLEKHYVCVLVENISGERNGSGLTFFITLRLCYV